ncbi:Small heat shock protein, chloroplastic [Senna tora]|uniref:Small heat shock protein, chloroplastic n=1 Tax=Senna tora TaxID=362788 RepID=A0A834T3P5_9FABA|nr:Small heat shock protein, chloroplastic [Senna tora]
MFVMQLDAQEVRLIDMWSDVAESFFFSTKPPTDFWLFGAPLIKLLFCTLAFLSAREREGLDVVALVADVAEDSNSLRLTCSRLPYSIKRNMSDITCKAVTGNPTNPSSLVSEQFLNNQTQKPVTVSRNLSFTQTNEENSKWSLMRKRNLPPRLRKKKYHIFSSTHTFTSSFVIPGISNLILYSSSPSFISHGVLPLLYTSSPSLAAGGNIGDDGHSPVLKAKGSSIILSIVSIICCTVFAVGNLSHRPAIFKCLSLASPAAMALTGEKLRCLENEPLEEDDDPYGEGTWRPRFEDNA